MCRNIVLLAKAAPAHVINKAKTVVFEHQLSLIAVKDTGNEGGSFPRVQIQGQ